MEKIEKMNSLLKEIFNNKHSFLLFPFAICGLVFVMLFYIVASVYELFDIFIKDLQSVFYNIEKDNNHTQTVKTLLGFWFVVIFNLVKSCVAMPLTIFYFFTSIFFYVSSIGKLKTNPYIA